MKMQIILAKVPILKFVDRISQIEVTLNVNKAVSIRNTQLLKDYTKSKDILFILRSFVSIYVLFNQWIGVCSH